jgi:hypothetical protein
MLPESDTQHSSRYQPSDRVIVQYADATPKGERMEWPGTIIAVRAAAYVVAMDAPKGEEKYPFGLQSQLRKGDLLTVPREKLRLELGPPVLPPT